MKRVLKKQYDNLFKNRVPLFTGYHVIFFAEHPTTVVKVAAKKKIGNAVERNNIKRRLRTIFTILQKENIFPKALLLVVAIRALPKDDGNYLKEKKMLQAALIKSSKFGIKQEIRA